MDMILTVIIALCVDNNIEPECADLSVRSGFSHKKRSIVVGVTGGIASGKSTICAMFKELGAEVISADEIAHMYMQENTAVKKAIADEFGDSIVDSNGDINRKLLGGIVFNDYEKLRKLESIMHPHILNCIETASNNFRNFGKGILVIEFPLLIETSSMHMVDKIIVVSAKQSTQIKRLQNRASISEKEALQRIKSQISIKKKKKFADWVVDTEESTIVNSEYIRRIWCALQNSLAHTK